MKSVRKKKQAALPAVQVNIEMLALLTLIAEGYAKAIINSMR